MSAHIHNHFQKVDPILFAVIEKIGGIPTVSKKENSQFFVELCSSIVSQQLSTKVADVIWARFEGLFEQKYITPLRVLELDTEIIRAQGISYSKIKYLKDLAQKVNDKQLLLENIDQLSDEEVILELTKVKGIGRWTAEMFLMFSLAREDVFSTGDLGLKRAVQKVYKLEEEPSLVDLLQISKKWSPYRTHASRILWKSLEITL